MSYPTDTQAFCTTCSAVVPARVVELRGSLFLESKCPGCGARRSIVEHDAGLYRKWERARRPHRPPERSQTAESRGCPFDCGLCGNHRQKSCIALLEVTESCDLGCPVCYADSGSGEFLSLETIERMLDAAVESADGQPEVLQVSGGEPTCHPRIMEILRAAMERPFKYVMLNTNGLSLQNGGVDVEALASLGRGFEVHLQFDGLDDDVYRVLRGRPLLDRKLATLDALAAHDVPATLVATLRRGLNLESAGDLLRFALEHRAVRGINFQCEACFGRNPETETPDERVTQTEVVGVLVESAGELIEIQDVLPLSCGLACMVYLEKTSDEWKPIPRILAGELQGNPLTATVDDLIEATATACLCKRGAMLEALAARLPGDVREQPPEDLSRFVQERFFHLTVVSFLDGRNFDLNRACRECVHILRPDGRKMPFSAYNTVHRGARV